jgi:hypothetical protein
MTLSRISPTRLAAAVLTAGVVTATSVVNLPESHRLPTIGLDVANASVVTDALYGLGDGVGFLTSMVGIHVDATISLPFEATLAALSAAQDPTVAPNVVSHLVQRFVNPAVGGPIHAYPYDTEQAFAVLATLFPFPLGPSATEPGLINEARLAFADAFNSVLGRLPDPIPGFDAVQAVMHDTVLGGTVVAAQLAARAPLYMAWNIANYLGYLPANLEATVESAIADPAEIPGLTSNLVYGLLSPDAEVGLFGRLLDNAVNPATWLPEPIGQSTRPQVGLADEVRTVIDDTANHFLSVLPTPVKPSAAQDPPAELPTPASPKRLERTVGTTSSKIREAPATATHRTAGSRKDRVARALTRPDQDNPGKTGASKATRKASSGAA